MNDIGISWLSEYRVDGVVAVKVGRRGADLVAEFAGIGMFTWHGTPATMHLTPVEGVSPERLNKLSASLIDALGRHVNGKITLHGAAVRRGPATISILGPSGAGKSTLAAALCANASFDLVADDTIAVELPQDSGQGDSIEIIPTQSEAWLLPAARRALGFDAALPDKVPIAVSSSIVDRAFLAAAVHLTFDSDRPSPVLRRLHGQQAFSVLSRSAIRLVVDEPAAQLREFDQLRLLVERCPIFELRRANDLAQLGPSADCVRELFANVPAEE